MEAYLQHGQWGGPYRTESVPIKETESPLNQRHTGYPTPYMVKWCGRWRRVYRGHHPIWNVGAHYIKARGDIIVVRIVR